MRGFPADRLVFCVCGAAVGAADDPPSFKEPKLMLGRAEGVTGPPLGRCPLAPAALIVTDGFLVKSPLVALPLLTIVGPMAADDLLFESCWPFCGLEVVFDPCAAGVGGNDFLVALAYERMLDEEFDAEAKLAETVAAFDWTFDIKIVTLYRIANAGYLYRWRSKLVDALVVEGDFS